VRIRINATPAATTETERVRSIYDRLARRYDRLIGIAERLLFTGGRKWACEQAHGDVLEVAIGTGRNLAYYPAGVSLTGVDVSGRMLEFATKRAGDLDLDIALTRGDAQQLDFPDSSFDTVVATLTLCSIPDDAAAVQEMARVLRPGGQLRLLDHVASPNRIVRSLQRLLDPLMVRLEGDHLLRRPEASVLAAGLTITQLRRSKVGIVLALSAVKQQTSQPSSGPG